jgi:guanine nucleotide-binding protein subunit alpha
VSAHFPDYNGDDKNEREVKDFFSDRFRAINRTADREIYIHFTNATDTTLLRNTMNSVQDMIIQKNLEKLVL